ncbi:MAG: response regulator [Lachnospiraceae bacterium]|nr:response regulator [Lachnospiraceae bacterium]
MANALIVDDSRTSRKILRTILETSGYTVVGEATNGQEGIDKYKELKPDFVTLDITMPVKDGIEVLTEIKEFHKEAKVIMVTAAGQKVKMVEALKIGADDFISKPFDTDVLLETVKRIVG